MTQQNLHKGHDLLMEVSMPSSSKYGKHYTSDEINSIFAPSKSTFDSIHDWLESAGIQAEKISQSVNKQWMQIVSGGLNHESIFF